MPSALPRPPIAAAQWPTGGFPVTGNQRRARYRGRHGRRSDAVNDGGLTAEEADHLVHVLDGYVKVLTTHDLAVRVEALKSQMKEGTS